MNEIKNLEAKRAKAAFEFADEGNRKQAGDPKFNYSAAVQELLAIIRMNGLRAAMAFFYSKEKAHGLIFDQVRNWFFEKDPNGLLKSEFKSPQLEKKEDHRAFMQILIGLNDDKYRIAQAETMALASWMIRFVKTTEGDNAPKTAADGNAQ